MTSRTVQAYDTLVLHNPKLVLVVLLSILVFFGYHTKDFKLDASADSLLLEDDVDLNVYRKIHERYPSSDLLVVTYTSNKDLFSDHALELLKQLRGELKKVTSVDTVFTILDAPLFNSSDVPIQDLSSRIVSIYGSAYEKILLPVNMEKKPYNISGFAGNLSVLKKRQGEQYLFLNGRFIQNRLLNSAVYSAYHSLVRRGEYPFFALFLEMPMSVFDVNVHPAKLEVRFVNEWQVYHVIKSSIANVLQDILNVIPGYNQYGKSRPYIENQTSELPFSKGSIRAIRSGRSPTPEMTRETLAGSSESETKASTKPLSTRRMTEKTFG